MKSYISLIFIVLGTFIGAGCISGKEVAVYFTSYTQFILMAILASVAIIFLMIFYLNFGKKYAIHDFTDYNKVLFSKHSSIMNVCFVFCMLCMVGNMIAGLDIVLYNIIPNTLVINVFLILIIYIVVSHDIKGIETINILVVPIILVFIIGVCICTTNFTLIHDTMQFNNFSLFKVIIYIFLNVFDISILLCQVSKSYVSKVCIISSIISGVVIFFIAIIESFAMLSQDVLVLDFPILKLSSLINLDIIYYVISIFAMFTTLISSVYLIYSYLSKYCSKFISVIIISCGGITISLLGFSFIISYVYILIGIMGVVLFLKSFYVYYFKSNDKFTSQTVI